MRSLAEQSSSELRTERRLAGQGAATSRTTTASALVPGTAAGGNGTRAFRASISGSQIGELFVEDETRWVKRWTGTAWVYYAGIMYATAAERGAIVVDASDIGAPAVETDTGKDWYVDPTPTWIHQSLYDLPNVATGYKVGGNQVVGAQGAPIIDPAGGGVVDAEARAALIDLLNFFRGWGAIT